MNKIELNIFNRNFELEVIYDLVDNEEPSALQIETISNINDKLFDDNKEKLLKYILQTTQIEKLDDNLFKYIMPNSIYVMNDKQKRKFGLLCDYKFDLEHGLALLFENEKLVEIGSQDITL